MGWCGRRLGVSVIGVVPLTATERTDRETAMADGRAIAKDTLVAKSREYNIENQKSEIQDRDLPPAWDKNPSSWSERLPIVGLALTGCAIATYLALYQWRVFTDVWEPFFGDGSRTILNSSVSHILPIPDAALGAFGYFLDAATGIVGGRARWRTMPWMVVIFGLAVGPLGFVSVMLVIFQPVLFEAWCTLCLASALVSVLMIGPAADEVLASLQYLKREQVRGNSLWRAFWGLDQPEIGGRKSVRPGL